MVILVAILIIMEFIAVHFIEMMEKHSPLELI
jgi:hypothetical protein